jgi:hypothetical protein
MPGVTVGTVPALSSPDAGAALSSPADSATDAFVEDLMQADRPVEIWICAYVRVAAQQLQELATSLDSKAVPPGPVREACREKMLANMRLLIRFLLVRSPGEWTAWDFAPLWSPGPLEPVQRLRYWYGATTRYVQRMSKASNARYNPGSLDEFDVEGAAADCLDLMIAFIATLAKIGSPYVSFIDSKRNVRGSRSPRSSGSCMYTSPAANSGALFCR